MDKHQATLDLTYVDEMTRRARLQLDPHAFHYVHWGLIVLVWFPLDTWFLSRGEQGWHMPLIVASVVGGMLLSAVREFRRRDDPGRQSEDRHFTRQVIWAVYASVGAGTVLSAVGPASGLIEQSGVQVVWGLVYANIAFITGLIYRRDFLWGAALIFAGTVAAIVFQPVSGYILGPCMGMGMIVPGLVAERCVRRESLAESG